MYFHCYITDVDLQLGYKLQAVINSENTQGSKQKKMIILLKQKLNLI